MYIATLLSGWLTSAAPGPPPSRMSGPPPASPGTRRWRRWRRSQLWPATPGHRSSPGASGWSRALCRVFLGFLHFQLVFLTCYSLLSNWWQQTGTHKLQGRGYYLRLSEAGTGKSRNIDLRLEVDIRNCLINHSLKTGNTVHACSKLDWSIQSISLVILPHKWDSRWIHRCLQSLQKRWPSFAQCWPARWWTMWPCSHQSPCQSRSRTFGFDYRHSSVPWNSQETLQPPRRSRVCWRLLYVIFCPKRNNLPSPGDSGECPWVLDGDGAVSDLDTGKIRKYALDCVTSHKPVYFNILHPHYLYSRIFTLHAWRLCLHSSSLNNIMITFLLCRS